MEKPHATYGIMNIDLEFGEELQTPDAAHNELTGSR
jgi:hypothetical protein